GARCWCACPYVGLGCWPAPPARLLGLLPKAQTVDAFRATSASAAGRRDVQAPSVRRECQRRAVAQVAREGERAPGGSAVGARPEWLARPAQANVESVRIRGVHGQRRDGGPERRTLPGRRW